MTAAPDRALSHRVFRIDQPTIRPRRLSPSETKIRESKSLLSLLHSSMRKPGRNAELPQPFPSRITCRNLNNQHENLSDQYLSSKYQYIVG